MRKKQFVFVAVMMLALSMIAAGLSESIDPLFGGLRFGMTREEAEKVLAQKKDNGPAYFTSDWEIFLNEEVYGCKFFYLTYETGRLKYISSYNSNELDKSPLFQERSAKLLAALGEPDYSMDKGTAALVDFKPEDPAVVGWSAQTEDASFTGDNTFSSIHILNYEQWIVETPAGDIWLIHHGEHEFRTEYVYDGSPQAYDGRQDEIELLPYTTAGSSISAEDAAISLTVKNNVTALTAGEKLTLKAAFVNSKKVNKKAKNDRLIWRLTDRTTGKTPADLSLNVKGANCTLSVPRTLSEPRSLEITVFSPIFHTSASWPLTVVPAITGIAVEPSELFFYTGTDTPQTVRAVITPAAVPPAGLTWTPAKKNVVEITETDAGVVSVRPVKAGKTTVTVKAPGGKSAKLSISVADPVESVELKVSGKATPGSTVTVKETLLPKKAGNKNVEWSLDVGNDIAMISKGKVKIMKNAPAGTVITVTCTATGAPEPVTAAVQITVTEK